MKMSPDDLSDKLKTQSGNQSSTSKPSVSQQQQANKDEPKIDAFEFIRSVGRDQSPAIDEVARQSIESEISKLKLTKSSGSGDGTEKVDRKFSQQESRSSESPAAVAFLGRLGTPARKKATQAFRQDTFHSLDDIEFGSTKIQPLPEQRKQAGSPYTSTGSSQAIVGDDYLRMPAIESRTQYCQKIKSDPNIRRKDSNK